MGPNHARDQKPIPDDVKALLREKDDRIATLETRLEAYTARASTAQTRLLKTIDVLDALRSQHALDMSAEEQAKLKLVRDVNRWRSVAKNREVEKDELKDVVEDLIEKVGYTSLNMQRGGNLNIEFPEQVAAGTVHGGETKEDYNSDLLAYATSIIARLRMELDVERQNHNRTVEEANLRIEELEAKVAVREAELETCIADHEHEPREPHDVPAQSVEKRTLGQRLPEPKPLSDEECLRFLESNSARNRSLEIEIRHIAERLEQARILAQSPAPRPSPRTRSASVDPNALSRPSDAGRDTSSPPAVSPSTTLSIAQLDNQIRTMTAQVDALTSERTTLIDAAARQRKVTDGINIDTFQDVLRVEAECVRLQSEVDDLREQLQYARSSARAREKALLREIARFRTSTRDRMRGEQLLEDDIAAEESMELASPLTPTVVLNPPLPTQPSRSLEADTGLVPFSFSPGRIFSPVPEVLRTPTPTARRSPGEQDIGSVQAALDVARVHLAQKEEAQVQLRAEMERLQMEVQAQTRGDGDGG